MVCGSLSVKNPANLFTGYFFSTSAIRNYLVICTVRNGDVDPRIIKIEGMRRHCPNGLQIKQVRPDKGLYSKYYS